MRSLLLLSLFIGICLNTFGQKGLQLNQPAPEIVVTDWILNKPEDTSFKGKAVVLEFWATWCGPCIAAVPHLNKLKQEFEGEDIEFISITRENRSKVERILKKVKFESIVVSDTTSQTHINFGDEKGPVSGIPYTILLDKNHVVRWIGHPKKLNNKLIEGLLLNQTLLTSTMSPESTSDSANIEAGLDVPMKDAMSIASNPAVIDTFYFKLGSSNGASVAGVIGNTLLYTNVPFNKLYKALLNNDIYSQIELPSSISEKNYTLIYKQQEPLDSLDFIELEAKVIEDLGLQKQMSLITQIGYKLSLRNSMNLTPTLESAFSAASEADSTIIITNHLLKDLKQVLMPYIKAPISISEEMKKDEKGYDFILQTTSPEELVESLTTYGFIVEKESIPTLTILLTSAE